jgi:hypothetical protein
MKTVVIMIAVAATMALSGCAKTPFPVLENKLGGLKGHPAKELVAVFGDPTDTQPGPEKTYVWTLPPYGGEAAGLACTVKVFVDKDDKITRYDFSGNVGGCGYYAHQIDPSYHRANGILDW